VLELVLCVMLYEQVFFIMLSKHSGKGEMTVQLKNVSKIIAPKPFLKNINLEVNSGEICRFDWVKWCWQDDNNENYEWLDGQL